MPTCLECNTEIKGRVDKKFCSDLCRNSYHNRQNADHTNLVRNINNKLRKNRRILEDFCPDEKNKVHRNKLADAGFDFAYVTHLRTTLKGSTYYFVYDYGYLELENDFFLLVKDSKKSAPTAT